MEQSLARIVHFRYCEVPHCCFETTLEKHLVVSELFVELHRGNATAITYTWGEYNRQRRTLGHFADGDAASLILGDEWELDNVVSTLEKLCRADNQRKEARGCWIDQLCIPQDDEFEIRQALASIPDIYRKLDVVVLLPGARCECLSRRLKALEVFAGNTERDEKAATFRDHRRCLNDLSFYTWTTRVWTRQELYYAQSIRIEWVSSETVPHPSWSVGQSWNTTDRPLSFAEREALTLPTKLALEHNYNNIQYKVKRQAKDNIDVVVQQLVDYMAQAAFENLGRSVERWMQYRMLPTDNTDWSILAPQFLSGRVFTSGKTIDHPLNMLSIHRFMDMLSEVSSSTRSATHARDYVLAVWVDCPRYIIPLEFKTLSVAALLQDALEQLERNFHFFPTTFAPSGIFSQQGPGTVWRPSWYLDKGRIAAIRDVYGVFAPIYCPYLNTDVCERCLSHHFPTVRYSNEPRDQHQLLVAGPSVSTGPRLYTDAFPRSEKLPGMQCLIQSAIYWQRHPRTYIQKLYSGEKERMYSWDDNTDEKIFWYIINLIPIWWRYRDKTTEDAKPTTKWFNNVPGSNEIGSEVPWHRQALETAFTEALNDPTFDHCQLAFRVVCAALGFDVDAATLSGLHVMVRLPTKACPPLIGLTTASSAELKDWDSRLVRLEHLQNDDEFGILYEAIQTENAYRIIGVWVPAEEIPFRTGSAEKTSEQRLGVKDILKKALRRG